MPTIRALLPSAIVVVDEREADDYLQHVPKSNLLTHPSLQGLPAIMNWMMEEIKTPVLVEIDDDFTGVKCLVGTRRYIMDPEEILGIIENSIQVCEDLGLSCFCYSRTANTFLLRPDERPILPQQLVANAKGLMGAARHRQFDTNMHGRADADWTLKTLLEDRIVYCDARFYFDCGAIYQGRGGSVGMIDAAQFEKASKILRQRWGAHVSYKSMGFIKNRQTPTLGIAVSRINKRAQK